MTFWHRNRHDDDTDLDQWIKSGLDAELAQMDAAFDFETGLADVYARAGRTRHEATEPRSHAATQPRSHAATQPRSHAATQPSIPASTSRGTLLARGPSRLWSTALRCSMPCWGR